MAFPLKLLKFHPVFVYLFNGPDQGISGWLFFLSVTPLAPPEGCYHPGLSGCLHLLRKGI